MLEKTILKSDWENLEEAIYIIGSPSGLNISFLGSLLQSVQINLTFETDVAEIRYIKDKKQYLIMVNPIPFRTFSLSERMGILLHEIEHMCKMHLSRIPPLGDKRKANFAADAVVNQVVPGIPRSGDYAGIFPEDYGLEKNLSLEDYYDLWPDSHEESDPETAKGSHNWDDCDETEIMDSLEDIVKRTMIKTNTDYNNLPGGIKEILSVIDKKRKVIDWKRQLRAFCRKTITGVDRESTRSRPNKRYGYESPGLKTSEMPKVLFLEDTSGSMSVDEINVGLDELDQILKVGSRSIEIGFWHTKLYHTVKYKKGTRNSLHKKVESGGTDFESCAKYINKMKPDACIVFTDGYFSDTKTKVNHPVLFIISSDGVDKLPTKYPFQKAIKLPPNHSK